MRLEGLAADPRFLRGLEEYRAGRHFEAHERWEALWLKEPEPNVKSLLQALIQIAAAMHKLCAQRAPDSAARLLDRALARLGAIPAATAGLAVPALLAEVARARAEVQKLGQGASGGDPIPRLETVLGEGRTLETARVTSPIAGGRSMDAAGKTGIEISPGISAAQRKTDALLHAVHLDWFGAAIKSLASGATMTITVDGNKRREPWAGVHFVDCAPGTRSLELEWDSHTIGGHSLAPLKCDVTVEPGKITEVVYTVQTVTSHGAPAASLEIKGTRAS